MGDYKYTLLMDGDGSSQLTLPSGYQFMSVINNTDNVIYVHQERTGTNNPSYAIVAVPRYTSLTIPIEIRREFTLFFEDGGASGQKTAQFIFSMDNLNINSLLGTNVTGNVTLTGDNVGLLREADLNIDGDKDLQVDVKTIPKMMLEPKTAVKVTAGGSGDQTVKASAGIVYGIVISNGIDVILKNGTNEVWACGLFQPPVPISCGTSIILNFSGAGHAYIIYE